MKQVAREPGASERGARFLRRYNPDMNTTERLYYTDSHLVEFDARVVEVSRAEDGRAAVTLDRTAFYPTGGGQPNDTGTLGPAHVVDCSEDEGANVLHVLEGDAPEVGADV